jgi:hypothetical protein
VLGGEFEQDVGQGRGTLADEGLQGLGGGLAGHDGNSPRRAQPGKTSAAAGYQVSRAGRHHRGVGGAGQNV